MEGQTIDTRLKLVETKADTLDKRVTQHGRELDEVSFIVNEMKVNNRHRDETMSRIEGKVDTLVMKPAESFDRLKWLIIGGFASVLIAFLLATVGIK